jgi:hypothetical protein
VRRRCVRAGYDKVILEEETGHQLAEAFWSTPLCIPTLLNFGPTLRHHRLCAFVIRSNRSEGSMFISISGKKSPKSPAIAARVLVLCSAHV